MKLFTVGPAQMFESTLEVAGRQIPYFRNEQFSNVVLDCERKLKEFVDAPNDARVITLTASGTGAMEASIMNCLDPDRDSALVVNGGTFGARFEKICEIHGIPFAGVHLARHEQLKRDHLEESVKEHHTALLVNADETSTGQLYDLDMLSEFTRDNDLFFVVDAISAFLSDPISMTDSNIDVLIISSQKALAIAPGLSFVVLSDRAQKRIDDIDVRSMYFDFKDYLLNAERGQTPFTPAVGIVYELYDRLCAIGNNGGVRKELERVSFLADDFRNRIAGLPIDVFEFKKSNALTMILFKEPIAKQIYKTLYEEYGYVLNPCGGEFADYALRVAHIGDLTIDDNEHLVDAIRHSMRNAMSSDGAIE